MEFPFFLLGALLIIVFFLAIRAKNEVQGVKSDLESLREYASLLRLEIIKLQKELAELRATRATPEPVVVETEEKPVSEPVIIEPAAKATIIPQPKVEEAMPEAASPSEPEAEEHPVAAAAMSAEGAQPSHSPPSPDPPTTEPARSFDWEALVGVRLFSWIAGVALAIAAVFFLRYSIDHGWLNPSVRMALGILTGCALLVVCELKAARRYPVTANALDAAAIAILYSTFYATHALWNLIGTIPAFAAMIGITAVAVLLSIKRESIFIALLGLVGGFSTPALLSTGEDRPIGLFSYLLLLNVGLAWVAYRKRWPALTILSVVFTTFYQWAWVVKFLTAGKLPLAIGIFLIFPIAAVVAFALAGRFETENKSIFERTTIFSAALPLLFALYLSAVPSFGARFELLFAYLLCLDIGLAIVAIGLRRDLLHLAGAVSTVLTFALWLNLSYQSAAWPEILFLAAPFIVLYLVAEVIARRLDRPFIAAEKAAYASSLLLFVYLVLNAIEKAAAAPLLLFSLLFALVTAIAAFAIRRERRHLFSLAAIFTVAAKAVWTSEFLSNERIFVSLGIDIAFALLFLSVPFFALRYGATERIRDELAPSLDFSLAGYLLLAMTAATKDGGLPNVWSAALAILVVAVAIGAVRRERGELHLASVVFAQIVLWIGLRNAVEDPWPTVVLFVSVGLSAFSILWLSRSSETTRSLFAAAACASLILTQVLAISAGAVPGRPHYILLVLTHVASVVALMAMGMLREWHFVGLIAVIPSTIAMFRWRGMDGSGEGWLVDLLFGATIYLLFIAYPLIVTQRAVEAREPFIGAVLASAGFFFYARYVVLDAGGEDVIGLLPIAQAAFLALILWRLVRVEPREDRDLGRLAVVAGAALAFITVAIPLQLDKEWITIGWALEGAALAWLYRKIPHRGLLLMSFALAASAFVRLVFNPAVLSYHPRGEIAVFNWYLYTYLIPAAAFFAAAALLRKTDDRLAEGPLRISSALAAGGTFLLFLLLNIEIADYYSTGKTLTFNFSATLAQDLSYTIGWGLFGILLLVAGILLRNKPARVSSLALLLITVFKCFLHDLGRLGGLYRVASFVGLAFCLALVAVLLQRFVLSAPKPQSGEAG